MNYRVTIAADSLDPNPEVKYFDCFDDAQDHITEHVYRSVEWLVSHSPYSIDEEEYDCMVEQEMSLCRLEKI